MHVAAALAVGMIIGSFLNVVIHRLPRGESVVHPPSHCPQCGQRLGPLDLIPVLSYLVLRGRCRYCRLPVSPVYPAVELAAGILAAGAVFVHGPTAGGVAGALLLLILLALSVIDVRHFILPDRIVGPGILLGLPLVVVRDWPHWWHPLVGMATGGLIFILIVLVSRGGMGGGDIKLAAMIGLYLGWQLALLGFMLAFVLGGIAGVALLVRGRKGLKDHLPFGPFLAAGAAVALLWGRWILAWYVGGTLGW